MRVGTHHRRGPSDSPAIPPLYLCIQIAYSLFIRNGYIPGQLQIAPPVGRVLIAPRLLNPTLTRTINPCKGQQLRSIISVAAPARRDGRDPILATLFAVRTTGKVFPFLVSGTI